MLNRRQLVLGAATAALPRLALAGVPGDRRFVLVILRGGLDGLAALVPHGDPNYARLRGSLALRKPGEAEGVIDLDGFFGLHPALAPLAGFWRSGEAAFVPAMAISYRGRSHFAAQDALEHGYPDRPADDSGWLNRALRNLNGTALAVAPVVPLVLRGPAHVASWAPTRLPGTEADLLSAVAALYRTDPLLGPSVQEGLRTRASANAALQGEDKMSAGNAAGPFAFAGLAKAAGHMLSAADGPRIATFELGGWDTHANQGSAKGQLATRLQGLAQGLVELQRALGPAWASTVVLVASEFGRTVRQNGTGGTDHGTAGVGMLLGGAVNGGRIIGRWPGIAPGDLYEGRDLAPTTDFRALAKGVLREHLGVATLALDDEVFPESNPAMKGLLRA